MMHISRTDLRAIVSRKKNFELEISSYANLYRFGAGYILSCVATDSKLLQETAEETLKLAEVS